MTASTHVTYWAAGPVDFGDPSAEERAARHSAALFDLTGRTHLVLTGRDRARFLHGFCTNDVKRLQPGEGCEAFVTNLKGRILEHVFLAVEPEAIHLNGTAGFEEPLFAHLDRYLITDDVQIARRSPELADYFLSGPQAPALVASHAELPEWKPYGHRAAVIAGVDCRLQRLDLLAAPGVMVTCLRAAADTLRPALQSVATEAGRGVFEALRIEAGLPSYGVDLSDENLAQEAMRTEKCISFKKGCYLGQEPIARLDALGHVNRQLALVRFDVDVAVPQKTPLKSSDGKEAGAVSSSAVVPSTNRTVALGLIRSTYAQPHTELFVDSPAGLVRGEVAAFAAAP